MRFNYHDLYDRQFERLVVEICHELLGPGVQEFASGKDGGRDGRFEGTAKDFPSSAAPLNGKFIIQAKHTTHPFAKVSDSDFGSEAQSSTVSAEIEKLKLLQSNGEADFYLFFTNRRGVADAIVALTERIKAESKVRHVHIFGIENIDRLLKAYPGAAVRADLKAFDAPLRVFPDELAKVITKLADCKDTFDGGLNIQSAEIHRTKFSEKNSVNNLSKDYADFVLKYLKDFGPVKTFLASPDNTRIQESYVAATEEFQSAIISHRNDFECFDRVLDYLLQLLIERDSDLARNPRLTRMLLYYMYWNCDIGKGEGGDDTGQ